MGAPRIKVAILGAGAYGTALAQTLARAGRATDILLIEHFLDVVDGINQGHENPRFLPGVKLSPRIRAAGHASAATGATVLLLTVPSGHAEAALKNASPDLDDGIPVVVGSKGFWGTPVRRGDLAAARAAPGHLIFALGGGALAGELAAGQASTLVVGGPHPAAAAIADLLRGPGVKVEITDDAAGVALGSAMKNIYALGLAVSESFCGGGDNWRAAYFCLALAEMGRLCIALGGRAETLYGPAGLGDLIATGSSPRSRNRRLGLLLQAGKPLADAITELQHRPEGLDALAWLRTQPAAEARQAPLLHAIAAALDGDGGPVRACFAL